MTSPNQDVPQMVKTCKRGHDYPWGKSQCPVCVAMNRKVWEEKNKESRRIYYARYDAGRRQKRAVERDTDEFRRKSNEYRKKRWAVNAGNMQDKQRKWVRKCPEKTILYGMKSRCTNPKNRAYKNYGGRGIDVCDRWSGENGFQNFFEDMGRRPSCHYSIERRDNDRGYSPDNCYWATRAQQARNRRNNRFLEFNGERMCLTDWAAKLGIESSLLSMRLNLLKWPLSRALTTGPTVRYERGVPIDSRKSL